MHTVAPDFWGDVAVTVVGSRGQARVVLGGGWEVMTAAGTWCAGQADPTPQEARHLALLADWLDDPTAVLPASFAARYHGLEVLMGLALSSLERRPVDLPIEDAGSDILTRLARALRHAGRA